MDSPDDRPPLVRLVAKLFARRAVAGSRAPLLNLECLDDRVLPTGTPAWAVGAAAGAEPRVWVYDSAGALVTSFLAYESTFTGGVRVAVADLDGDAVMDVVTAAGPGGGPRVRTFDGATWAGEADFFAYESTFTGGVNVAAGPIGGGDVGIVTGADAGGGPHVRVIAPDGTGLHDFFAFDETYTGGVRVAVGDPGNGPKVYATNGAGMAPTLRAFDVPTSGLVFEAAAGDVNSTGGVLLACGDVNGDGADDVITAAASGTDTEVRLFDGATGYWANAMTVPGTADGIGVMTRNGTPAVGVLSGGVLTAYTFAETFGDTPTTLGSGTTSGGAGSSIGSHTDVIPPPVLATDTATVTGPYGEAEVSMKVTAVAEGRYRWEYVVTNTEFLYSWVDWPLAGDLGYFSLDVPAEVRSSIIRRGNDRGWLSGDELFGGENIFWSVTAGGVGQLGWGEKATFWFETPAVGIAQDNATQVADSSGAASATAESIITGPADGPQIVITWNRDSADVPGPPGLRIAKWHDAFDPTYDSTGKEDGAVIRGPNGGGGADAGWDFIDRDRDRFNVWVYDRGLWDLGVQHNEAKISTTNVVGFTEYNDNATPVDLVRYTGIDKGSGWYWSDSQLLVSNIIDDQHTEPGYLQADDTGPGAAGTPKNGYSAAETWRVSDRTHKVALRGTVHATYQPVVGPPIADSAPVPQTKNLKVHVTILIGPGGTPVIDPSDANQRLHKANEQFAQIGLLVIPYPIEVKPQPAGVNLADGFTYLNNNLGIVPEVSPLFSAGYESQAADDIELFFVNTFTPTTSWGTSYTFRPENPARFQGKVVLRVGTTPFTAPHELGHIVLNTIIGDGHYWGRLRFVNLMNAGTSTSDTVASTKRFTLDQAKTAYDANSKASNLLSGP